MNRRLLPGLMALTLSGLVAAAAEARNPHCAGGIQYVVQGLRDKDKGNTEDYLRQMGKAIDQLSLCATEDPADLEAIGYLGWAYAEFDSAGPAGEAFRTAIEGFTAKGEKKKLDIVVNNRESYWAKAFNEGINEINNAQAAYKKRHSGIKDANFECGIQSYGNARIPFSVKYFIVAILFVLFDV